MLTGYDQGRLSRYRDFENYREKHTFNKLLEVYTRWVNECGRRRDDEWDAYCDVRDGYEIGTNSKIREKYGVYLQ